MDARRLRRHDTWQFDDCIEDISNRVSFNQPPPSSWHRGRTHIPRSPSAAQRRPRLLLAPDQQQMTAAPSRDQQQMTAPPSRDQQQMTAPPSCDQQQMTAPPSHDQQQVTALPSCDQQQMTASPSRDQLIINTHPGARPRQRELLQCPLVNEHGICPSPTVHHQWRIESPTVNQRELFESSIFNHQSRFESPRINQIELYKSPRINQRELYESHRVNQRELYESPRVNQRELFESPTVNEHGLFESPTASRQRIFGIHTVTQRSVFDSITMNQGQLYERHTVNQRQQYERPTVNQQKRHEHSTVNQQRVYQNHTVNQQEPHGSTSVYQQKRYETHTINQRQRHDIPTVTHRRLHERSTVYQREQYKCPPVNQQRHQRFESPTVNQQRKQSYESPTANQQRQRYESATCSQQKLQHRPTADRQFGMQVSVGLPSAERCAGSYVAEAAPQVRETGWKERACAHLSVPTSVCSPTQPRGEQRQSHRVAGGAQENISWEDSWKTSRNNYGTASIEAAYNNNLPLTELAGMAGVCHKLEDYCSNRLPKPRGARLGDEGVSHWSPVAWPHRVTLLQTPQTNRHHFKSNSPSRSQYNIAHRAFADNDSQSSTEDNISKNRDRIVTNHGGDQSGKLSVDSASRLPGSCTSTLEMSARPLKTTSQPAIPVLSGDMCSNTDPDNQTGHFTMDTSRSTRTSNRSEETLHPDNQTTHKANYTNVKPQPPQVFTCNSGHELVDKSAWGQLEPVKAEGSDSVRGEVDHKKTRITRHVMMVLLVLLVVAVAVVCGVLSVALGTDPAFVRATVTLKILNRHFDDQLSTFGSEAFRKLAVPFSLELGGLFLKSNLARVYRHNEIVSFRNGSIYATSAMTFVDAGLISSPQDIENVIETADVAVDWSSGDALKLGQFVVCRSCTDTQVEFVSAGQQPRVTQETSETSPGSAPTTSVYRTSAAATEYFTLSPPTTTTSVIALNFSRTPTDTVDSTPAVHAAERSTTITAVTAMTNMATNVTSPSSSTAKLWTTQTRSPSTADDTLSTQPTNPDTSSHRTVAQAGIVPTSAPPTVTFQPSNAFLAEGLAGLSCSLFRVSAWSEIVIGRARSSTDAEVVLSATRNGTVTWYDTSLSRRAIANLCLGSDRNVTGSDRDVTGSDRDVTGSDKDVLEIWIYVLKCADAGNYTCDVRGPTLFHNTHAQLAVYAHPESPTLTVPASLVEGDGQAAKITCEARLGMPAAALTLKMKPPHQQTFEAVNFTDAPAEAMAGCTAPVSRSYVLPASQMINETVFRCEVTSSSDIHKHVQLASEERHLYILKATVCQGAGPTLLPHPWDCRHFVQCVHSEVSVLSCSSGLCFNVGSQQCDIVTVTSSPYVKDDTCIADSLFLPHPTLCDKYIHCVKGRKVIQHCPQGQVYAIDGLCTSDIRKAWCYKS